MHPYSHSNGTGHVAAKRGDYYDCIENRKARLHLVTFEAGLGGLLPYGASRLRRMGRLAKASGADPTDYTTSSSARSFVARLCHSTRSASPRPAC